MRQTRRRYLGGLLPVGGIVSMSGCLGALNRGVKLRLDNQGNSTVSGEIIIQSGNEVLKSHVFRLDPTEGQEIFETTEKRDYPVEVIIDDSVKEVTWDSGRCSGGEIQILEDLDLRMAYMC